MNAERLPATAGPVVGIVVNGERRELDPASSGILLTWLRSGLGLTATGRRLRARPMLQGPAGG